MLNMNKLRHYLILLLLATGCASHTPIHHGLGNHIFPISSKSSEAQQIFNRAMTLTYGFSHMAAEKEFRRAAELDPLSPMPWWGVALVNGPHINFPLLPDDKAKVAWDALTRAQSLKQNGNALEQQLIDALSKRYSKKNVDRPKHDNAYAAAMKKVRANFPEDADVITLYAESLMDLHPWDLFDSEGNAKPWTEEVTSTLESALALNPRHPGATHLYIHAIEASNYPERAVPAADTLQSLVPDSGHLVHMPGHIYIRVGRWEDAAAANIAAIKADKLFREQFPNPGFYAVYMTHNHHFLTFVRMMQGQKARALEAADAMLAGMPPQLIKDFEPIVDGFFALKLEVLMRFGEWNQILVEPEPALSAPYTRSIWRFARASAFNALDKESDAINERELFLQAIKKVPATTTFGNNSAHTLLKIAEHVLDGEIAARGADYGHALMHLNEAVRIEGTLSYDEPPDWILPVRHALGITLLRAGKAREAEAVYRRDLKKFPGNGWSLFGLSRALELQGKTLEAKEVKDQFKRTWADADTQIKGSCLCQPAA